MFGTPDHDAVALDEELAGAPAAGFFAAGEIGPVGGEPFLHGFTATVAVFPREPRRADRPAHRRDGRARPRDRAAPARRGRARSSSPAAGPRCSSRSPPRPAPRAVPVDLADLAAVERLATDHAGVDVLVANAGLSASGHVLSFSVEEIDRALAVNLRAPMVLARVIGERMAARGSGHMVFMSSLNGKAGTLRAAVYGATKFGLRGFAQGMRQDLRSSGVGVSAVFPGFVRDAGMFADSGAKLPAGAGTVRPRGGRRRRRAGDRAQPRRDRRRARSACGWAPRSRASPPRSRRR